MEPEDQLPVLAVVRVVRGRAPFVNGRTPSRIVLHSCRLRVVSRRSLLSLHRKRARRLPQQLGMLAQCLRHRPCQFTQQPVQRTTQLGTPGCQLLCWLRCREGLQDLQSCSTDSAVAWSMSFLGRRYLSGCLPS